MVGIFSVVDAVLAVEDCCPGSRMEAGAGEPLDDFNGMIRVVNHGQSWPSDGTVVVVVLMWLTLSRDEQVPEVFFPIASERWSFFSKDISGWLL